MHFQNKYQIGTHFSQIWRLIKVPNSFRLVLNYLLSYRFAAGIHRWEIKQSRKIEILRKNIQYMTKFENLS